jgi:hypothetical protein
VFSAATLSEALRPKAKENLSAGGKKAGRGRPAEQGSSILTEAIDVREQAAKEAGSMRPADPKHALNLFDPVIERRDGQPANGTRHQSPRDQRPDDDVLAVS